MSDAVGRRGVTLLEMVAVLAISGVVMGMTFGVGHTAMRIWRVQSERSAAVRSGWRATMRIAGELRAIPAAAATAGGRPVGDADGSADLAEAAGLSAEAAADPAAQVTLRQDKVSFLATSVIDGEGKKCLGRVEYAIQQGEDGRALGLARRSAPRGFDVEEQEFRVVDARVMSVEFLFRDRAGRWTGRWGEEKHGLPSAVQIKVGSRAPGLRGVPQIISYSTIVNIPAARRIAP